MRIFTLLRAGIVATFLTAALAIAVIGHMGTHAAAPDVRTAPPKEPLCLINITPKTIESGLFGTESSIAAVIQVGCEPIYSQNTVTINATQLNYLCHGTLSWTEPPSAPGAVGSSFFTVKLDNDGNATAIVWGGPSCAPGQALITASMNVPPFPTMSTTYRIAPPKNTRPGVTAVPSSQVEDSATSSVATVIQVEFPSSQAEQTVNISSSELFAACGTPGTGGAVAWYGPEEALLGAGVTNVNVTLDNNGNAFVVFIGGPSCASGTYTIVADLTTAPYTTYTTTFTILSPRDTSP